MKTPAAKLPFPKILAATHVALLIAGLTTGSARAEEKEQMVEVSIDRMEAEGFPINDDNPESSVPTAEQAMRSPLKMGYHVMLLIERGDKASQAGEQKRAMRYYKALVKAIPERSKGYTLLCNAYDDMGDLASATEACKQALGKQGVTVEDNLHYTTLLMKKPGTLDKTDVEDIEATYAHLEKELAAEANTPVFIEQLRCDLATRLEDQQRLKSCVSKLEQRAPKDAKTMAYRWALLVSQRDFVGAQRLIGEAAHAGLPKPALAKMQSGLLAARQRAEGKRAEERSGWRLSALGLAALAGVVMAALYWVRRQRLVHAAS